ncbi:MAG: hypothetical protein HWD61_14320 [Parachlamydiaceae bacterium]|nr:MAG: hypothetical protein HWD61_14320 [Parachlamydiaceae bacterium]
MDQLNFEAWLERFGQFKYYAWLGKDLLPDLKHLGRPQGSHCAQRRYDRMLELKKNPPNYKVFEDCPAFDNLVENVEKRLEQYDLPLEMKKRMEALEPTLPNYFKLITMSDFEASWKNSALRIALLTHEEFESLTLEQLKTLTHAKRNLSSNALKST